MNLLDMYLLIVGLLVVFISMVMGALIVGDFIRFLAWVQEKWDEHFG